MPTTLAVTLTDLSAGMVDEAVARATANGFTHVTGRPCDIHPHANWRVRLHRSESVAPPLIVVA